MSELSVLKAARERLSPKSNWTQNAYAKDGKGNPIRATDDSAQCFCLMGAIQRECDLLTDEGRALYFRSLKLVSAQLPPKSTISAFNDNYGHKAVLRLLDAAITSAEAA
jgi:hypothetical protein